MDLLDKVARKIDDLNKVKLGVTADHRPYFVMELVRGQPITEFCDNHKLDVCQRLNLLIDVCSAVHHAHQKGVIHRDIKPSNVMVTLHDDKPVAKVIDFGVAKAIGQTLTDKTIYTRFFSMIGTPLYMSPEQAEMSGLDVDTRSDICSLGVMTYELLAGATPFDRDRLDSAGLDELRRIIREEEPPRPSRRLTTLGNRMTTVSTARRTEPSRLTSLLSGDLDWIVMKAIEKDRGRRYESAAAMDDDIKRFLLEQPIVARPPTLTYQFSKFASRHRTAIATLLLIATTMLLATGISLWQMSFAMDERDQKVQALREANEAKQRVEQFAKNMARANSLIASSQSHMNASRIKSANLDFDSAVVQLPSYYQPWVARAQFFTGAKAWKDAASDYSKALSLGAPTDTPSWWGTAALFLLTDRHEDYVALCRDLERRLSQPIDLPNWELLRDCGASDEYEFAVSRHELAQIAERWLVEQNDLEDRAFAQPPPHPRHGRLHREQAPSPLPRPVCLYIAGLSHLRAGNFEQAIVRLAEANDERWPAHDLTHALLAIAHHRLGHNKEAKSELAKSSAAISEANALAELMDTWDAGGPPPTPWFDAAELLITHAEATRAIESGIFVRPL